MIRTSRRFGTLSSLYQDRIATLFSVLSSIWKAYNVQKLGTTRIMVYKGMVYKGKYSISEKNKGMQVSIFG